MSGSTQAAMVRDHLVMLVVLVCLAGAAASTVRAERLRVQVLDARDGAPLPGAFVQIGPGPGDPFEGNWTLTDARGEAVFDDPFIVGAQTVTAGAEGFALLSVMDGVEGSITLRLHPETGGGGIAEPKAEFAGTVTGFEAQSHDGELDVAIVFPAVSLSSLLSTRALPFEVPSETVNLPVSGPTVLPGNVVIPSQTEYLFLEFSKPGYRFLVPEGAAYDVLVTAGRLPLASLGASEFPLEAVVMRLAGVERGIQAAGEVNLDIEADLPLLPGLSVSIPEAPSGTRVFATCVADLPGSGRDRTLFLDAGSALSDTAGAILLSGLRPSGDLSDAVPYLAGYYADSSAAGLYQSGRVDRTPLNLPAARSLEGLYRTPDPVQFGEEFTWNSLRLAGTAPRPTWTVSSFRLEEDGREPATLWEVWAPASWDGFRLPILDPSAPGGLPDPGQTPGHDRLVWDLLAADPSGGIEEVMSRFFSSLTRWSRRTVEISPPLVQVEEFGLGTMRNDLLRFRLAPNPGRSVRDILWDSPPPMGALVSWVVWDVSGRRLQGGTFASSGSAWDRHALRGTEGLPAGIYWVRLRTSRGSGSMPLIVAH